MKTLIYVHGFISSPASYKARQTYEYLSTHRSDIQFVCPQLENTPAEAAKQLQLLLNEYAHGEIGLIGSSLGGFYSSWLSELHDCKAVLVNPAVRPDRLLRSYLGDHIHPYTQEAFHLGEEHMQELVDLERNAVVDQRTWVLLQTGDETLDYRHAQQRYQGAKMTVEQGGDHSFVGFERYLAQICTFLF